MATHRTATLVAFLLGCGAGDPGDRTQQLELVGAYLTGVHPVTAVVADLDGDGDLDLAAPGLVTPELVVLENDGGEIRWHPPIALADGVMELVAVDVDGDGRLELAASHREKEAVTIYRITSSAGGFAVELADEVAIDGLVTALRVVDLDGDGDPDLATSRFAGDTVELLRNDGGHFEPAATIATSHGPYAIRFADLDGDSVQEMAVLGAGSDEIAVFAGAGTEWSRAWSVTTDHWPSSLEIADLDGDGALELIGTATIGDRVFAVDIDENGGSYRVIGDGDGAFGVRPGDANGDGVLELAVTNKDAGTLSVMDSLGGSELIFDLGFNTGPSPVYRWDLDGDGRAELLAVVCAFANQVSIVRWR